MSSAGRLVMAYHGCDASLERQLLLRETEQELSDNPYDWLGEGAYFFEDDPQRALDFARASAAHPERRYTARPIAEPAVIGAVLRIERWLDLTTQAGIDEFVTAYEGLARVITASGGTMPVNKAAGPEDVDLILHNLDRAVINFLHEARDEQKLPSYQAVRGVFRQGAPVVETSAFQRGSHVQIALRNLSCIVGYFRVDPEADPHPESRMR